MNKIVTTLVVAMIFIASSIYAQTSLTLSPTQIDGNTGETVSVQVIVNDFTDIVSMQFVVQWDPAVIQFESVDNLNLKDLTEGNFNPDAAGGILSFSWFESSTLGTSLDNGATIFSINYTVLGGANSGSTITFESRPGLQIEIADTSGEITNAVTLTNAQFGDPNGNGGGGAIGNTDPLISSISSGAGDNGTTVCLNVNVSNFTDITQMQYSINWDASVLDFSEVRNLNLTGLTQSSFETSNTTNGQLGVDWANINSASVADGTNIYQICFNLIGAAGSNSSVSFSSNPVPIIVTTTASPTTSVGLTQSNATVSINNDVTPPPTTGTGTNLVNIPDLNTDAGTTICVPVTVSDFDAIASLQFSLQWDPTVIQFSELDNFNLPDLAATNFNTTNAGSGRLALAWFDNTAQGVSRNDGETIFEVCFNVIGTIGTGSNINFTDNPTSREAATSNNTIAFTETNGSVTIGSGTQPPPVMPPSDLDQLVNIATMNADSGSTVCVPFTVSDFDGIASLQFSLAWDPAILQFTEVTNFNLPDLSEAGFNTTNVANGQTAMAWFDNTAQGVTLTDGSTIFEICFLVIGNTGSTSAINFSDNPTPREAATAATTIPFTETNGAVTVGSGVVDPPPPPPPTGDGIINIANVLATPNESVCVPVTVRDFNNIAAMQFSLDWDATILAFTGTQNFGLTDLAASSFNTDNATTGNVSVAWFDQAAQGITLQDDVVIFEICFNVLGSTGASSTIVFSDVPTPRELATVDQTIDFLGTNGSVTVGATPPSGDEILNIGSFTGSNGENICMPVTLRDFDEIASVQFSLAWDPTVLQFTETTNFGLPDLNAASFNTDGSANGQLAVAWFDQAAQGVTLADGTTAFEVCFDIIGAEGESTSIQFTDIPTPREIATPTGTLPFTNTDGTFTVGQDSVVMPPPPPPSLDNLVNIAAVNVQPGESFCAPIVVSDFDDIASLQFSLGWDPSVIQYTGVQSFGLPDLNAGGFNEGGTTNGALSVAWFDNTAQGVTLDNGAVLFEVCFTAVGADGTSTIIAFTDTPTPREASTASVIVPFTQTNGLVTIGDATACPGAVTATLASTNISCNGEADGTITVTASGGDNIYSYQWSDPAIGNIANPTNLSPGSYSVTVSSCGGQVSDIMTVTLTEPTAIVAAITPQDASCFGVADGRINVSVIGGTQPYTYTWSDSTLAPSNRPVNALAGAYSLTITDANGCEDITNNIAISSPTQIVSTIETTNASCSGIMDGIVRLTPSGGSGSGYTFDWGNPDIIGGTPTNVAEGDYLVTVTDSDQCTAAIAVTVGADIMVSSMVQVIEDACGDGRGAIQITPTGGREPYFFDWSGSPVDIENTNTAERLPTGIYTVLVVDSDGCFFRDSIEVEGPTATLSVNGITQNTDCPDDEMGSISIAPAGGFASYTFEWSNGATTQDLDNIAPGTYTVTVTDSKACTVEQSFIVTSTSDMSLNASIDKGAPDATVSVVVTGGVAPFTYEWCDGQNGSTATGLDQGICTLTVIDALGCTIVENIDVIVDNPAPQILIANPITCNGETNGILQAQVVGGSAPFTYAWNTGANSNILVNVGAGTYEVTVTDNNGGTGVMSFNLTEPDPIQITAEVTPDCMFDGALEISISGGTMPYANIAWSNGLNDVLRLEGLRQGDYGVIVTDQNDCTAEETFRVGPDRTCVDCFASIKVMTPNADGRNDAFRISCVDIADNNHLEIYNRWGQLVFEADNYQCALGSEADCWRGRNRTDRIVDEGGYFWVLEFDEGGTRRRIRDHVTIVRDE